jgi:hypothetical protein
MMKNLVNVNIDIVFMLIYLSNRSMYFGIYRKIMMREQAKARRISFSHNPTLISIGWKGIKQREEN